MLSVNLGLTMTEQTNSQVLHYIITTAYTKSRCRSAPKWDSRQMDTSKNGRVRAGGVGGS